MSETVKWLLTAFVLTLVVVLILSWRKAWPRMCPSRTLTGTVPSDQSFPFSAESVLAGKDRAEYTVFEFIVDSGNNGRVDLTSFTLTSAEGGNALAGDFILPRGGSDTSKYSFTNTTQSITIDFTKSPEGRLTLRKGDSASIVVLALPQSYSGLTAVITGDPIGTKRLDLEYADGQHLLFSAMKRHRIYGLCLPEDLKNKN